MGGSVNFNRVFPGNMAFSIGGLEKIFRREVRMVIYSDALLSTAIQSLQTDRQTDRQTDLLLLNVKKSPVSRAPARGRRSIPGRASIRAASRHIPNSNPFVAGAARPRRRLCRGAGAGSPYSGGARIASPGRHLPPAREGVRG